MRNPRAIFWIGVVCFAMAVAALTLAPFTLTGCSKSGPSTFTPAMRTSDTAASVAVDAAQWVALDPVHRFSAAVAPTHSMEPVINEHSTILCLRYTGQPLLNGAVAIVKESAALPRVLHVISAQTADSVFMSGYNNRTSDGWFPKSAIEGFVVGQLYLP